MKASRRPIVVMRKTVLQGAGKVARRLTGNMEQQGRLLITALKSE